MESVTATMLRFINKTAMNIFNHVVFKSFLIALSIFSVVACSSDDDNDPVDETATQTLLMYMPWSGSSIYSYFINNINAFETAIENNNGLDGRRFLVFIAQNTSTSYLIDFSYKNGACVRDTLKTYSFATTDYTTATGIASILNDVKTVAPANAYSLLIGSHGMGWVPSGIDVATRSSSAKYVRRAATDSGRQLTRFFGHSDDADYQTDIQTLAEGISAAGIKMKYILFDDCYMSNIETAYDLKDVSEYLIASTCEVMIEGMPYKVVGAYLLYNDYENVVNGYYSYYSTYSTPCGTIGVTDCSEVDNTVALMEEINTLYPSGLSSTADIQVLDGFTSPVFFDFGNYVDSLCTDETLRAQFDEQIEKLVPYKAATETFYSMFLSGNGRKQINAFSGITVSDPTTNASVVSAKTQTNWYKATH